MAADLNLPRGDDGWHQLRSGYIPQEFTQRSPLKHVFNFVILQTSLVIPAFVISDLSPDLKEVIHLMMNPIHEERITSSQLLSSPIVKKVRAIYDGYYAKRKFWPFSISVFCFFFRLPRGEHERSSSSLWSVLPSSFPSIYSSS